MNTAKTIGLYLVSIIFCNSLATSARAQVIVNIEYQNGVYVLPGKINGLELKFIYDTGAADVMLSAVEAQFMLKNGYLNENDFTGEKTYQLANGETIIGTTINIRKLDIGGIVLKNIVAGILPSNDALLLIGQSALKKLGRVEFDYENKVLIIYNSLGDSLEDGILVRNDMNSSNNPINSKSNQIRAFTGEYLYITSFNDIAVNPILREAPSLTSKIVYTAPMLSTIYVIEDFDNVFAKVHINGYTGYISKRFLKRRP